LGPTAAGKSDLAIRLAEELDAQIVSVDSMQVYRGMDIGTAKPSTADRARIIHHMIDVVDPDVRYSAAEFQREGRRVLQELAEQGATALITGGSGLHFRALVDPLEFPPHDPEVRARIEAAGTAAGRARLLEIDSAVDEVLDLANPRRVERALEVYELTGETPSERASGLSGQAVAAYQPWLPFTAVGVDPGIELAQRIDQRWQVMLAAGFLNEVARLAGVLGPTAIAAVGYKQLLPVVLGDTPQQRGEENARRATMSLAKRQRTYFRRDPRIEWVPWSSDPDQRYERIRRCLVEDT
jgi:tRNA dimethylallyltransferase